MKVILGIAIGWMVLVSGVEALEVDRYGGNRALKTEATGFFRVEKFGERWLLVTPEGHGYFALGANHLGKYLDVQAEEMGMFKRLGGGRAEAVAFLEKRMREMGLNAGEAYGPLSEELKGAFPWVAKVNFPGPSKFAFDVFDEGFQKELHEHTVRQCRRFKEDPMIIGITYTDLPVWDARRVKFFERLPKGAPGAMELARFREAGKPDEEFLGHVAETLYRVMRKAMREGAPNHLFMGEKFRLRGAPDAVISAVGKYVDVFCTQALILSPQRPPEWQLFQTEGYDHEYALAGKPMVMIDWAAPFSLSETWETKDGTFYSEKEASEQAAEWLVEAARQPYMVGVFKCQLIGLHGKDLEFDGKSRRTYLKDDGRDYEFRTKITRESHAEALRVAYGVGE